MILHVATDEGDGPPLILLHGWPQHSGIWRQVIPTLSTRYRCIALDLRGFGQSPAPPDGYDKPTLAADVIETMDSLGIDKARFIGHDWGAVCVAIIALEHPERMVKGIMFSVPAPWDTKVDPRRLLGLAHMPFMASPLGPRIAPNLGKRLMKLSGLGERDAEEYVAPMRAPDRRRASALVYRTFLLKELPGALRDRRDPPEVPVRVVGGDRDPVCRWSTMDDTVRGAGHFIPDQKPDVVIGHAMSFL